MQTIASVTSGERWEKALALFPRDRWILWLPAAMGLGIWLYFSLPSEPSRAWHGVVVALLLAVIFINRPALRLVLVACLTASIGFSVSMWRVDRLEHVRLTKETEALWIYANVETTQPTEKGRRVVLSDIWGRDWGDQAKPELIQVSFRDTSVPLHPGDRISFKAKLYPPPAPAYPEGFDFSRNSWFKRIGAVGFSFTKPKIYNTAENAKYPQWRWQWQGVRQRIAEQLHTIIPGAYGGIAIALLTGERGYIPEDVAETLRIAGLAHILAISGLHIGMICAIVFYMIIKLLSVIHRISLYYNTRKIAAVISLMAGAVYLLLSGFPVSAIRAFVMVSFFLLAVLVERVKTPMRVLAWAAIVILLVTPEALLSAGFQLSFAATAGIIAWVEMQQWQEKERIPLGFFAKLMRGAKGVILTSLIAGLATAPFTVTHFQQASVFGIISNLVAIPLMGFWVMPLGLISLILLSLGVSPEISFIPMGWGIEVIALVAGWVSSLPFSQMHAFPLTSWGMWFVAAGGLWLVIWTTPVRWLGVTLWITGLSSSLFYTMPDMLISKSRIALNTYDNNMIIIGNTRKNFELKLWMDAYQVERIHKAKEVEEVECQQGFCSYDERDRHWLLVENNTSPAELDTSHCRDDYNLILARTKSLTYCADVLKSVIPAQAGIHNHVLWNNEKSSLVILTDEMLTANGNHALWWEGEGRYRLETVRDWQGSRPWSAF